MGIALVVVVKFHSSSSQLSTLKYSSQANKYKRKKVEDINRHSRDNQSYHLDFICEEDRLTYTNGQVPSKAI
jgi:hypothetical protein